MVKDLPVPIASWQARMSTVMVEESRKVTASRFAPDRADAGAGDQPVEQVGELIAAIEVQFTGQGDRAAVGVAVDAAVPSGFDTTHLLLSRSGPASADMVLRSSSVVVSSGDAAWEEFGA
jgi:hypothetical protein